MIKPDPVRSSNDPMDIIFWEIYEASEQYVRQELYGKPMYYIFVGCHPMAWRSVWSEFLAIPRRKKLINIFNSEL